MTKLEHDMIGIGEFLWRFYGALAAVIVALPLLDRILDFLPPVLEQRTVASLAGTIVAIALIGRDYLESQDAGMGARLPFGTVYVFLAVLLTVGYVGVGELIQQRRLAVPATLEVALLAWYVALYGFLAFGMWQMTWRAYRTRDQKIDLMLP